VLVVDVFELSLLVLLLLLVLVDGDDDDDDETPSGGQYCSSKAGSGAVK
jgi:hypothetical protein